MYYLLILENSKIYIKLILKLLLHVLVYDHHQGSYTRAWLKLHFNISVTLARLKCKLPDDGRGPKHVGAILIQVLI
jgi:hypothetical protein